MNRTPEDNTEKFIQKIYGTALYEQLKARARRVAGDKAGKLDPSGLVVEAVLRAVQERDGLQDETRLKAWLTTIVVNEVLAKLRLAEMRTQALPAEEQLPARPGQMQESDEQKIELLRLLEQLSEADRRVICLRELEGLSYPDIAEKLGITEEAVRQRRCRALDRLKKLAARTNASQEGLP
jgi:RNA polymerase sigma-70 factor (ECF subfamily)